MSTALEVALIGATATIVTALVTYVLNHSLNEATVTKVLVEADAVEVQAAREAAEASLMLLDPLTGRVLELETKLDEALLQLSKALTEVEACHQARAADKERHRLEREADHLEMSAMRSRLRTLEDDLAHYKGGPSAHYD